MIDVVRLKLTYLLNFFNELSLLFQNHWSVVFGVAKVETFSELTSDLKYFFIFFQRT